MINGKRSAEAESMSSVFLCQRNRSCPAPSHAYQSQPAHSPSEQPHFIQICPGSYLKVIIPGSDQTSFITQTTCHHNSPSWRRFRAMLPGSLHEVLATGVFTYVEVLASHWSHCQGPSVSTCQSLWSSGIREMGWFRSAACAKEPLDIWKLRLDKHAAWCSECTTPAGGDSKSCFLNPLSSFWLLIYN